MDDDAKGKQGRRELAFWTIFIVLTVAFRAMRILEVASTGVMRSREKWPPRAFVRRGSSNLPRVSWGGCTFSGGGLLACPCTRRKLLCVNELW
jgi:hypothetical protein